MNGILVLSLTSTLIYIDSQKGKVSPLIKGLAGAIAVVLLYDIFQSVQQIGRPQLAQTGIGGTLKMLEGQKADPQRGILAITLPVTSTAQQMPYGKTVYGELRVSCPVGNTGSVFIADSPAGCTSGPRYEIAAGDSETIKVTELSSLFFIGTDGDNLSLFSEVENG
jgi:hypothetical protein